MYMPMAPFDFQYSYVMVMSSFGLELILLYHFHLQPQLVESHRYLLLIPPLLIKSTYSLPLLEI